MTTYAGETVIITQTATLNGEAVEVADVDQVTVAIFDREGTEVIVETQMSYSTEEERWEYQWDTSPGGSTPLAIAPGTYKAKIVMYGLDDAENWEWLRIRLARNPFD